MKIISLILIALSAVTASPVFAAEWWLVGDRNAIGGEAPNRTILFVDRASIGREGSKVLAWTAIERESVKADGALSARAYQRFDCALRKFVSLKVQAFDENDKMIGWGDIPLSDQTETVIPPNTPADSALKFVCGDQAGSPHKVPEGIRIGTVADMMFSEE